jgi:hypothetical protein
MNAPFAGPSQLLRGNPALLGYSPAGVRYGDGTVSISRTDLSSQGFGTPWLQGGDWSSQATYAPTNVEGNGWAAPQLPALQSTNSGNTIIAVTSGEDARYFDNNLGSWVERQFLQDTLADNTTAHQFTRGGRTGPGTTSRRLASSSPPQPDSHDKVGLPSLIPDPFQLRAADQIGTWWEAPSAVWRRRLS